FGQQRVRAGAAGRHFITALGIIRRLRHPRGGACRHCAGDRAVRGTLMSHYFFGAPPLCPTTSAVTALSRCVMLSAAAGALITRCGTAQRLPTAQSRAAARAIHLAAVALAAQAHAD